MLRPTLGVCGLAGIALLAGACSNDDPDTNESMDNITCSVPADCGSASPTVACSSGVCIDPTWGCIGKPDDRPSASSLATLRVRLVDIGSSRPLAGSVITKVCTVPTSNAPACTPLPGGAAEYDANTGLVNVTGLPANQPFRLVIEPGSGSSFYPIDFYTQRLPRGVAEEVPVVITLSIQAGEALASAYDPPIVVRPDGTHVLANFVDCTGKPAAGVAIEVNTPEKFAESRILYMGADGLPDLTRPSSSAVGIGIGLNTPTANPIDVRGRVGTMALPTLTVRGFPGHLTVLNMYPRAY